MLTVSGRPPGRSRGDQPGPVLTIVSDRPVVQGTEYALVSSGRGVAGEPTRGAGVGSVRRWASRALRRADEHLVRPEGGSAAFAVRGLGFGPSLVGSPQLHDAQSYMRSNIFSLSLPEFTVGGNPAEQRVENRDPRNVVDLASVALLAHVNRARRLGGASRREGRFRD